MTGLAADLLVTGRVRAGLTAAEVADVLRLAQDGHHYDWLVRRRGWSTERYQRWYVDTVAGALFDQGQEPDEIRAVEQNPARPAT